MIEKSIESSVKPSVLPNNGNATAFADSNSTTTPKTSELKQAELDKDKHKKEKHKPSISKGEKVFNWTAYTGLNYFINLFASIGIADYLVNGNGRPKLNNAVSTTTKLLTVLKVPLQKAHHNSKVAIETLTLLSGGVLLLAPLKWMEDNKRSIVHKLNKKFGVNQKTEDGHEKTSDEIYIETEQPKQTWSNVIFRRTEATVAVIASGVGLDHFARNKKKILPAETHDLGWTKVHYDAKVQGGRARVEEKAFGWIDRVATAVRGKKFPENGIASRLTKLAILDSIFTFLTAIIMKVTSGAKKAKAPSEIDNSDHPKIVKDSYNRITTVADVERRNKSFSSRIERRVNGLIEHKHGGVAPKQSFVESVQGKDTPVAIVNSL